MREFYQAQADKAATIARMADATVAMLRDEGVTGPRLRAAVARANGLRSKAGYAAAKARGFAQQMARQGR